MIYRCPGCGSALVYSPQENGMRCKYCNQVYQMYELVGEPEADDVQVNTYEEPREDEKMIQENWGNQKSFEVKVYSCTACGAELMVNENEASTFCAYCGQPTVVFSRVSKELQPDYCVPFTLTGEQAVAKIRAKLNKGMFVPDEIKNVKVDKLRGIYVPYWLHDVKIRERANIKAEKGSGKQRHTVYCFRDAEATYHRVTSDASRKLNDELSQRLEPYGMNELKDFKPEFLSGFYADRYDVEEEQTRAIAGLRAKEFIEEDIISTVKYSSPKIIDSDYRYEILQQEYALLPAWFMTFWYKQQLYTILVNGQTGKVVGNVPISKKKVGAFLGILTPILAFVMGIIMKVLFPIMMESDDGDGSKFLIMIVVLIGGFFIKEMSNLVKYHRERSYFMSSSTVSYVKERQENEWGQ